jgi:hypothetical protein
VSSTPPGAGSAASVARLDALARALQAVPGRGDAAAGAALYPLAQHGIPAPLAVAVRCGAGRAALWLAAAFADAGRGRVIALDPWPTEAGMGGYGLSRDPCAALQRHAVSLALGEHLVCERGEPFERAQHWSHGTGIGLLHLEGGDDYALRVREFEAWSRFLAPGGVVVLDGFPHQAACTRLAAELPRWYVWEAVLPGKWVGRKLAA